MEVFKQELAFQKGFGISTLRDTQKSNEQDPEQTNLI